MGKLGQIYFPITFRFGVRFRALFCVLGRFPNSLTFFINT